MITRVSSVAVVLTLCAPFVACTPRKFLTPTAATLAEEPKEEPAEVPRKEKFLYRDSPEVRDALQLYQKTGEAPVIKGDEFLQFPYGESEPLLACIPLHACDIELQPGETVTTVALGDAERWVAQPATSGDASAPTPHVVIKPTDYGLTTNVVVFTSRRTYHIALLSPPKDLTPASYARQVKFYYPQEFVQRVAETARAAEHERETEVAKLPSLTAVKLDFDYVISGDKPRWRPVRAFDDGTHVYVQMPDGMRTSEAPTLMVGTSEGNALVNYRIKGSFYVVDKLFDEAYLMAGVGWRQEKVSIAYTGKRGS